jgi:hypothetical protein
MPASILAAISSFQKVFFGENDIALIRVIKIIRLQVLLI